MDKETFEKAVEIQREINWMEQNVDGRMTLFEKIDFPIDAESVISSLWVVYKNEISAFCEDLVKRYKKERMERIEQLKKEFDAL